MKRVNILILVLMNLVINYPDLIHGKEPERRPEIHENWARASKLLEDINKLATESILLIDEMKYSRSIASHGRNIEFDKETGRIIAPQNKPSAPLIIPR